MNIKIRIRRNQLELFEESILYMNRYREDFKCEILKVKFPNPYSIDVIISEITTQELFELGQFVKFNECKTDCKELAIENQSLNITNTLTNNLLNS